MLVKGKAGRNYNFKYCITGRNLHHCKLALRCFNAAFGFHMICEHHLNQNAHKKDRHTSGIGPAIHQNYR